MSLDINCGGVRLETGANTDIHTTYHTLCTVQRIELQTMVNEDFAITGKAPIRS